MPPKRIRFGIFMPPFNSPATQGATSSLMRNVETIKLLDELGYDEAWVGEHHSAGVEIIADPLLFLMHVAGQTRHIRLGTGVISLPYHNPLWTADRIILADHLLRGRLMVGLGPGSLPTDAAMIGLEPADLRPALDHDTDVLMQLLRGDEPVTVTTDRYELVDARCQLALWSDPLDMVVAASVSPAGPMLAGRHGLGIISLGAMMQGAEGLTMHWDRLQVEAAEHGHVPDRKNWRLMGPMHLAETREQAIEDVRYGLDAWAEYTQDVLALPTLRAAGDTFEERVDWINESGLGVIGTPDDAIARISELDEQSGGFGCFIMLAHDWANWDATRRHYELFARHVAPRFQPSSARLQASEAAARAVHDDLYEKNGAAIQAWTDQNQRTVPRAATR
jgi:limonene 1,2-monooxygenase